MTGALNGPDCLHLPRSAHPPRAFALPTMSRRLRVTQQVVSERQERGQRYHRMRGERLQVHRERVVCRRVRFPPAYDGRPAPARCDAEGIPTPGPRSVAASASGVRHTYGQGTAPELVHVTRPCRVGDRGEFVPIQAATTWSSSPATVLRSMKTGRPSPPWTRKSMLASE
jgi:hypothetical protein